MFDRYESAGSDPKGGSSSEDDISKKKYRAYIKGPPKVWDPLNRKGAQESDDQVHQLPTAKV